MKNGIFKRLIGVAAAGILSLTSIPITRGVTSDAAKVLTTSPSHTQETGTYNGYHHEIWQADTPNSSTMTLADEGGGFSTSWKCGPNNSRGNFLARRGLFYGRNTGKHWQDRGKFTCDFACDWSAGSSGNSRICIYGWTENPLVEFYIIEDWKNWVPSSGSAKQVTIDGSVYDVFTNAMNSYNITGSNGPFTQYISVRKTPRTSGTISVYKHFEAWESLGMKMGDLYEVAFNVEGWESDGEANVKKMTMSTNGGGDEPTTTTVVTTSKPVEPDVNGDYLVASFDSGKDDWIARGDDTSITLDTKNYYDGKQSLAVSNRGQEWNGAAVQLDSTKIVAGGTYSISAAVLQQSGSAVDMQISLQQGSGNSATYTKIASVSAKSGEWTKIENKEFTIPDGTGDMLLYVETPDGSGSLTDFNIDAVQVSKSGKASSVTTGGGTVNSSSSSNVTTTTSSTVTTSSSSSGSGDTKGIPAHQNNNYTYDANGTGFKDYMGPYFRLGTAVNARNIQNPQVQEFIKKNFNSITCENEMKPDTICDRSRSSGDNIAINLSSAAPILNFCAQNGIGLRGHTFVWYSQTPGWIFRENFSDNGAMVSPERMNKRLESMIKNTFAELAKYPGLKLYSYDVCNELFKNDGGGFRGDGGEFSDWWSCYKSDQFVINAFKYARQYAPKDCKLYMNDYNEYFVTKCDDLYKMAKKIKEAGDYIDGIGMQSHMHAADFGKTGSATKSTDPQFGTYADAIDKFNSLGLDVQITELDVTNCADAKGASLFVDIFKVAMERSKKISSLTLWGHCDSASWRNTYQDGGKPLPFDSNCQPKSFYNDIIALSGKVEVQPLEGEVATTTTTTTTIATTTKAAETTTTPASTQGSTSSDTPSVTIWGDANCDEQVNLADAVLIMQCITNPDKYGVGKTDGMTKQGEANGDVANSGDGLTNKDALAIQKYKLGLLSTLPESKAEKKTEPVTTNAPAATTTKAAETTTTTTTTNAAETTTTTTTAAPANYVKSNFESGSGDWVGRGDATLTANSDNYYAGGKSIKVSGRSKNWNGAALTLDSSYKAGSTYSFSAAVLQKASESDDFKISLEYSNGTSEKQYDTIAEAKASKNTWTKLENTAYTIPAGATDLVIYIETADTTIDFYVDEAAVSAEGTKSDITNGKGTVSDDPEPEVGQVDPSKPMIAISFDDGASPANNKRIVDALAKEGFHATFFYVGNWTNSDAGKEEVKYAYSKGMEIANHTMTHPYLGQKSSSEIRQEVDGCNDLLKSIIGAEPAKLLRLPYLDQGGAVKSTLTDYGLVTCAIDTQDYNKVSVDQIVNKIKSAMADGSGNGAVVLCHETEANTVTAIEQLAPYIKAQGWQVVTISEMYAAKGKSIPYGQIITRA